MSDEQDKDSLLVDQKDALGCYFDALLLPDENTCLEKSPLFKPESKAESKPEIEAEPEPEPIKISEKVITKGPVSPKPRLRERSLNSNSKQMPASSKIIFASKNNEGQETEQVLIPRSQRLAAAKKITQVPNIARIAPRIKPSGRKVSITSPEAPKLDLSLFLPKIKTLSEEEISQQIEALTQAAVNQAQMESDRVHVAELEQVSKKILKTQSESDGPVRNIANAPSWAVPGFQALLFTVAGLKLAVPLMELNGIVEWGDEYITELPGHKPWYLGIIQNQGKNIPVIDTLQQVVPQKRWPENYLKEKTFKHIILIDNFRWGLACETVLEVITLKTDSVKWRSSRTKRRWLLGTVIDHMCALLDSSEFAAMLKTGDDSLMT